MVESTPQHQGSMIKRPQHMIDGDQVQQSTSQLMDSFGRLKTSVDSYVPAVLVKVVLVDDEFLLQFCCNTLAKQ